MKKGNSVPVTFKGEAGAEAVILCKVWSVRADGFEIEEKNTVGHRLRFGPSGVCLNSDTPYGSISVKGEICL
jgi:hypothetical protein